MILSNEHRETLKRWMPMIAVLIGIWLLARGMRRMFWPVFGLAWGLTWAAQSIPFWR
jgi:hypothetical protein